MKNKRPRHSRGARAARGAIRAPIVAKVRRTSKQAYGSQSSWEEQKRCVKQRDGHRCVKCSSPVNLQVDHIIPIAQGGKTVMTNLWTLCLDCHCKRPRHNKVAKLLRAGASYRKKKGKKR